MKLHKIIWTPHAQDDLKAIRRFIARDAPVTAQLFVQRLTISVRRLRQFPETGSIVSEFGRSDVREILHGPYRIIYRLGVNKIDILTVYHSARLLDQLDL